MHSGSSRQRDLLGLSVYPRISKPTSSGVRDKVVDRHGGRLPGVHPSLSAGLPPRRTRGGTRGHVCPSHPSFLFRQGRRPEADVHPEERSGKTPTPHVCPSGRGPRESWRGIRTGPPSPLPRPRSGTSPGLGPRRGEDRKADVLSPRTSPDRDGTRRTAPVRPLRTDSTGWGKDGRPRRSKSPHRRTDRKVSSRDVYTPDRHSCVPRTLFPPSSQGHRCPVGSSPSRSEDTFDNARVPRETGPPFPNLVFRVREVGSRSVSELPTSGGLLESGEVATTGYDPEGVAQGGVEVGP